MHVALEPPAPEADRRCETEEISPALEADAEADPGAEQPFVPQSQEPAPQTPGPSHAEPPQQARQAEAAATVEAILFAADSPLPAAKVAQIAQLPAKAVRAAVAALNDRYEQVGAAFRIEEIAGGFQMLTLGEYRDVLERLHSARADSRLTQAALETLAVVAYRQPVLRADIEAIRGVACGEVLRGLLDKQLVRIAGRAQVLGRPLLYGTTRHFLELFGLASLEDLPKAEELRAPAQKETGTGAPQAAPQEPAAAAQPASPAESQAAAPAVKSQPAPPTAAAPGNESSQAIPAASPLPPAADPAADEGQYAPQSQPSPASPLE